MTAIMVKMTDRELMAMAEQFRNSMGEIIPAEQHEAFLVHLLDYFNYPLSVLGGPQLVNEVLEENGRTVLSPDEMSDFVESHWKYVTEQGQMLLKSQILTALKIDGRFYFRQRNGGKDVLDAL